MGVWKQRQHEVPADRAMLCMRLLLNQLFEDLSNLFRTLLGVSLLTAFIVNERDTEARLVPFGPLKIATQTCQ
jgi:hypothetical protein